MDHVPGPPSRPHPGLHLLRLTTLSLGPHAQGMGTPASAVAPFSSVSAIAPYNPQEWVASPLVAERPQYISTEASVPHMATVPPPPYSPPRQRPATGVTEHASPNPIPAQLVASPLAGGVVAAGSQSPAFPPPPPSRGESRERLFGLSSLMRRRDAEPTSAATHNTGTQVPAPMPVPIRTAGGPGRMPQRRPLTLYMDVLEGPQSLTRLGPESAPVAPGARRAASASAAVTLTSTGFEFGSEPQPQWDRTMRLPPPPQGPPPQSRPPSAASPGLSRSTALRRDDSRTRQQVPNPHNDPSSSASESSTPRAPPRRATAGHVQQQAPDNLPRPEPPQPNDTNRHPARPAARDRSLSSSQSFSVTTPCSSVFSHVTKQDALSQDAAQFCQAAIERFREFAIKEAGAQSDAERVRLFADFFVGESRVRRERYSSAIAAMGSEVLDLTRDLFRPMNPDSRRPSQSHSYSHPQSEWAAQSSEPARSNRGSTSSIPRIRELSHPRHASAPMSRDSSPSTLRPGLVGANSGRAPLSLSIGHSASLNTANYIPCLSPILSQSMSDNHDGENSRGRPASRWWETDSLVGRQSQADKRTKRESKYMGVPREQWAEEWADAEEEKERLRQSFETTESAELSSGGKGNTLEPLGGTAAGTAPSSQQADAQADALDVSRLVSLPPPYPRHHPAVSNSHPELADTRSAVRTVSDLSELERNKEKFLASSQAAQKSFNAAAAERKKTFRQRVQQDLESASISFADAAAREQEFERGERERAKEMAKSDFAEFQAQVVTPLHETLMARIGRATELFDRLASELLDSGGRSARPDVLQEEGDDKPELLEKLTLLKWVFDARETLHRAVYDLLSDRNDRYRDVILTPYRLANNAEKMQSAGEFFAQDAAKRQREFDGAASERTAEFRGVVERTATKGIEEQMSAFWDIAPSLDRVLEQIPQDVGALRVRIPPAEYAENPAYVQHPLQYLYSLLLHAEKSTYQFIEAQTNLLCLLHEAKEAAMHARVKAGGEKEEGEEGEEERRLTDELKDKVREVQEQWRSALGGGIESVKERVGEWLLRTGGWDEALEDAGPAGGLCNLGCYLYL